MNTIGKLESIKISNGFNTMLVNNNIIIPLNDIIIRKHSLLNDKKKVYQIKLILSGSIDYLIFLNKHDRDFVFDCIVDNMEFGRNLVKEYVDGNY